jgi:outer membrane protein assembly factor BamB
MKLRLVLCAIFLAAAAASAESWPQWRGPDRNGVAPESPALVTELPKDGVPKVWQSEKVPSGGGGGYGSVVVSGGKVYLYVAWKYKEPIETRTLSERALVGLGWSKVKLPDDLSAKVEEARNSEEREKLDRKAVRKWVTDWINANLEGDQKKKFARYVQKRLTAGKKATPLELLGKLETIKGKEFASQEEIDKWFAENGIEGDTKRLVMKRIPTQVDKAHDVVLCLNAEDGKTLWQAKFDGKAQGHGSSATPCVADGRVYATGTDGFVYCFDIEDGKEVWKKQVGNGARNSSPLVTDGVAVTFAGALTALDAGTGEVKWTCKEVSSANSSPSLWTHGEKNYIVANGRKGVACVDPADGKVLWTVKGGGGNCSAAVSGDHAAVLTSKLRVFKMTPEKAEKVWEVDLKDRGASPIIHDGHVYGIAKGRAVCVELETGTVKWDQKAKIAEISSPILADGKIFIYGGGGIMMIGADPEKCTMMGTMKCPLAVCTSPAIMDGRMYLRMKDSVACYDFTKKTE